MSPRTKLIGLLVIFALAVLGALGFEWATAIMLWGVLIIFVISVIVVLISWSF